MKNKQFKITTAVALLLTVIAFVACRRADTIIDADTSVAPEGIMSEQSAMESFAAILSKAVVACPELRDFLKNNALEAFDKDYDVFYPYARYKEVYDGNTFESVLLNFCEIDMLERILQSAPKLTVLVPDYSWVNENCFSIHSWDTSSGSVLVGYDCTSAIRPVYYDGEVALTLTDTDYPSFPILIVKSNERMMVKPITKSGGPEYEFTNQYFDNTSGKTKVWTWEGDYENTTENVSERCDLFEEVGYKISATDLMAICPDAIDAFEEFNTGFGNGVQRDYLYYGMTNAQSTNGMLNPYRRDMIYRIKIIPSMLLVAMDATNDPLSVMGTNRQG